MTAVPVIKLDRDTGQAAKEINAACEDTGFFVITGHGVPPDALAGLVQVTREFFALPEAVKRLASADPPDPYCGYTHPADPWADGSQTRQLEKYEAGTFDTAADMAAAGYGQRWLDQLRPNIWPAGPPGFRQAWHRYLGEMHALGDRLMGLMSLALDLPREYLPGKCAGARSFLVANNYWPAPAGQPGQEFRLPGHTDIEALTILWRDTDGDAGNEGIEVHVRDGEWERVPVVPGSFIVNLGDMMAFWTNGRYRATEHRVRNGGARVSVPFFHGPRADEPLDVIPSCVIPGQPRPDRIWAAGDWTRMRMDSLSPGGEVTA